MRSLLILLPLIATLACQSGDPHAEMDEHDHEHEHAIQDHHDEVHLLQRQMDVMDIQIGHFQELDLSRTVKSNGRLELPPQKQAQVTALIGGRVKSIEVFPGRFVKDGQVLAVMEQPEFIDLQEQFLSAQSRFHFLESELERKEQLAADSLSSKRMVQEVQAEYLAVRARMQAAEAKLALLGLDVAELMEKGIQHDLLIRAPIQGYIRSINVHTGSYVTPEQSMFAIVDNDHIHIDLMVYEKDIDQLSLGQEVMFHLTGKPDSIFRGKIFAVGRAFEEEPRALQVHAEIDNDEGGLLPGMYVDARIITSERRVEALPEDALVSHAGLHYIFILEEEHQGHGETEGDEEYVFHMVEVNTGLHDMGFVEVVTADALAPGDRIVTKGAYYLLAEWLKSQGGAEHHH